MNSGKFLDDTSLKTADYVRLEEKINNLQKSETIRKLRAGLPEYIRALLRHRSLLRLEAAGITPALEKAFLEKEAAQTQKLFQRLKDSAGVLELPQKLLVQLKREAKVDRECALETLREQLLERELIRFRKETDIAAKVWIPVMNGSALPGEIVLEKIRRGLKLTPEQRVRFDGLAIRRVFPVSDALRDEIFRLRERTGLSVAEFQNYALIGKDAWDAFYKPKAKEAPQKKTSQETLLKLVIGFALEEGAAWSFMGIAGGVFVVRRDLVFLACVCCGYQKPLLVMEILDFFAEDEAGNLLYANPYY